MPWGALPYVTESLLNQISLRHEATVIVKLKIMPRVLAHMCSGALWQTGIQRSGNCCSDFIALTVYGRSYLIINTYHVLEFIGFAFAKHPLSKQYVSAHAFPNHPRIVVY